MPTIKLGNCRCSIKGNKSMAGNNYIININCFKSCKNETGLLISEFENDLKP